MPGELLNAPLNSDGPECVMDLLTVDELLMIFYFMNIYDRLKAMRVCKLWYHILRDKRAWSVIDFHGNGPAKEKSSLPEISGEDNLRYTVYWQFPCIEKDILDFLGSYAGGNLKEIYLSLVTRGIMDYLRKHCPNLKTISLLGTKLEDYKVSSDNVKEMLFIPPRIQRYELVSPPLPKFDDNRDTDDWETLYQRRDQQILFFLSQNTNLRYLKLSGFSLSKAGMQALTKKDSNLEEIQILQPCLFNPKYEYSAFLDDILTHSVGELTTLKCLRIECHSVWHTSHLNLLPRRIGHWKQLKALALRGVHVSEEAFASMIPGLLNLESLELEGGSVSTAAVSLTGQYIKKIKYLEIGNGRFSEDSFKDLRNHPALEKVWIHQKYPFQQTVETIWLHEIYDFLVTLPKIKHVKLEGYRLLWLHTQERFPDIEGVEIEIKDVSEEIIINSPLMTTRY